MGSQLQQIKHFSKHKSFWLFAALSSLATLHFYYIWKISGKIPPLIDFLCWGSIFFLLWKKRNKIKFRGSFISSAIGMLIIFGALIRDVAVQNYRFPPRIDAFSGLFPLITLLGILLLTDGIKRLVNYSPEIVIALTTGIASPIIAVFNLIPSKLNIIAIFDAQLTAFMLHYIGIEVQRQDSIVSLSNGAIEVTAPCSSISPLAAILPLVVIFLYIHPANQIKKIYVCIGVALSVVFFNTIRLSLLALFVNHGNQASFEYWHGGEGAGIFSNLIVFLVAGLSYKILNYSPKVNYSLPSK